MSAGRNIIRHDAGPQYRTACCSDRSIDVQRMRWRLLQVRKSAKVIRLKNIPYPRCGWGPMIGRVPRNAWKLSKNSVCESRKSGQILVPSLSVLQMHDMEALPDERS